MIPPISLDVERAAANALPSRARDIRERYQQSGLYKSTGECIWTTQVYLPSPGHISSDGQCAVVLGPFVNAAHPSANDEVMFSLKHGRLSNVVIYRELSPLWWLKRTILAEPGVRCIGHRIDESESVFQMETNLLETITLDLNTGEVIGFSDPLGALFRLALPAIIVCMLFVWLARSDRKRIGIGKGVRNLFNR